MQKLKLVFSNILLIILFSCCVSVITGKEYTSKPIKHDIWNELLKKYVSPQGDVNYKGFVKDSTHLNEYLKLMSDNHPNEKYWSKNERLAYWINAYNAFTVKLIAKNYPINSIKELGGSIYKVNTTWDIKFIQIEDQTYDLNNIEHAKIRRQFDEPRIHFAVNCASESCPKLRNEAYTAEKLNAQLTDQTKYFINQDKYNKITPSKAQLSKLFDWYKGDFTADMSLIEFINQYANTKMNADVAIDYLDYSWKLNEAK